MTRREITAKLDSIVEFAGVADHIDSPVKWYSSGMYVRLGFAVAAHLDPEILLIDEVLAVGDEVFQEKCYRRVAELRRTGSTIVFISHDLSAVERLCRRALLMQRGQIAADDAAELVAAKYRRWAAGQAEPSSARESPGPKPIQIRSVDMRSTAGMPGAVCRTGYPLTTTVNYSAATATADVVIDVDYLSRGGNVIMCGQTTGLNGGLDVASGDGAVEFSFDEVGLQPGVYTVVATVADAQGNVIDRFSPPVRLTVEAGKNVRGYFYNAHSWRVHQPALVTRLER
jgi:energy-coupling factor transporter ATP-binding protein EcfA2